MRLHKVLPTTCPACYIWLFANVAVFLLEIWKIKIKMLSLCSKKKINYKMKINRLKHQFGLSP